MNLIARHSTQTKCNYALANNEKEIHKNVDARLTDTLKRIV